MCPSRRCFSTVGQPYSTSFNVRPKPLVLIVVIPGWGNEASPGLLDRNSIGFAACPAFEWRKNHEIDPRRVKRIPFIAAASGVFACGLTFGRLAGDARRPASAGSAAETETPAQIGAANPEARAGQAATIAQPKDFETRFESLRNTANQFERARAVLAIADGLDVSEVKAALARIEKYHGADSRELLARLVSRWAELDPGAAFEWTQALKADGCWEAIEAAVETWARRDAKAAEERIARLPSNFRTDRTLEALIKGVAESDPKNAFAIFQGNTDRLGEYFAKDFFELWAETDPASAAAAVVTLPTGPQRVRALRAVAEKWGQADRASALAWAESAETAKAASGPGGRIDPEVTAQILQPWLSEAPDAAREWIKGLPDGDKKYDLLQVLCKSVSDEDPQLASEFVSLLPAGSRQSAAGRALVKNWGDRDFSSALAWAKQADDGLRQTVLPDLVTRMAWNDLPGAMSLAQSIGGGKAQERATVSVLWQWSNRDPAAAAAWAATQPKNPVYWGWIARNWAGQDSAAATQWLTSLPDGSEKDVALADGAEALAKQEPQSAADWIALIGDEKKRNTAYESLARKWLETAPKAAQAWLENAPLSPEAKAKLLPAATP
jgi:hypothetical protein